MVRLEWNSQLPAWQPDAQPTESPVALVILSLHLTLLLLAFSCRYSILLEWINIFDEIVIQDCPTVDSQVQWHCQKKQLFLPQWSITCMGSILLQENYIRQNLLEWMVRYPQSFVFYLPPTSVTTDYRLQDNVMWQLHDHEAVWPSCWGAGL